jgi:hypothetical protein
VHIQPVSRVSVETRGDLRGVIEDEQGEPLTGAVVSAVGPVTVFSISERDGGFAFRNLPIGAYLVRAHLQGYVPARGRVLRVSGTDRPFTITLTRSAEPAEPAVLAAGIGAAETGDAAEKDAHDHDERAWRLRHLRRGVLKDAEQAVAGLVGDESLIGDSLDGLGRAVGGSARLATALFSDLSLNGQVNLLTTTSFNRPQDLFALDGLEPRGVAYVSLVAPGANGEWLMRGTITQGDVSSWIVAGSYRRAPDADHAYEAGLSYSTQQYVGGNGEALLAIPDAGRNVGAVYAYDDWAIAPRVRVGYGARYARYDYLPDESLLSPRLSVTVQPTSTLRVRAAASHRETAPGAGEFMPPAAGLWLPPERTFSQLSRAAFRPERLDHVEVAAERDVARGVVVGVRAFRQQVRDQVVTLFGVPMADSRRTIGHYHLASAGDFDARGWTVSASRAMGEGLRASLDYTQFVSRWRGGSPDEAALHQAAPSVLRKDERIHDMTATLESVIAATDTRVFFLYKLNTGFADAEDMTPSALRNVRFNVQVNQALPVRLFRGQWEMLVAINNLFSDEPLDASVYDELFVVQPPKRVLGGVTMRF